MNKPLSIDQRRTMLVAQGEFELERNQRDDKLQAWDAADEFLLNYVDDLRLLTAHGKLLILNDAFGALSVALANHPLYAWSDSFLAQQALRANLVANGYPETQVHCNSGVDFPAAAVDVVLIKVPGSLAMLEHQLYALRPILHRDSTIIAAGMARHVHSSTLALFESIIGPARTTRARKKARLILVERDHSMNEGRNSYPESYELEVDRRYRLWNHAGLFSRDRLDRGTRLMLEYLPVDPQYRRIVDLGCGNGVLGIVAAAFNPSASLLFCDESHMAIASARRNFDDAFAGTRDAEFRLGDGLDGVDDASADLVLLNPPFHQQRGRDTGIARKLFRDARRVLRPGGELRVVGNRHLGYHLQLGRLFGACETLSADSKFVILSAHKAPAS
jgi:16S rRNA (guanine1207-N2)-methyltransferase